MGYLFVSLVSKEGYGVCLWQLIYMEIAISSWDFTAILQKAV